MTRIEPRGTLSNRAEKPSDRENIYRKLADSIDDIFFAMDKDFRYTCWNRASERLTGIHAKDAIGKSLYEIFPASKGTEIERIYRNVLKTKKAKRFITKFGLNDNDLVFDISAYPSQNGLSVFARNITKLRQAEEDLREKEKEIRLIVDNLSGLVLYMDNQGRYKFVNKRYSDWFNISPKDILGKHYRQVLGEKAYRRLKDRVAEVLSGHTVNFEDELTFKNGDRRSVSVSYVPDFDELGKVKGFFVLVADITKRETLERQFSQLTQNIQEVFWLVGIRKSKGILYLSPAFERQWRIKPQVAYKDHDYKVLLDSIFKDDREQFSRIMRNFKRGEADFNVEFRIVWPDGSLRWLWAKGFPIRDKEGKIFRMAGLIQDITDRKVAEEALRKSEERFRTLAENIPGAVYRYDKEGQIHYISAEIETIAGYPAKDFIGNKVRSFNSIIHPDDAAKVIECTSDCFLSLSPCEMDYRIVHKNGSIHWVHDIFRGIKENEEKNWIDGVLYDITERKQAEKELQESHAELQNLTSSLHIVREEERARIAREIHDEIGQALTALKLDLAWLRKRQRQGHDLPGERIQSMLEVTQDTIHTVRRIATELRPRLLDDFGLAAAIEWQARDFEKRSGIRTSVAVNTGNLSISEEVKTAIFRILQEALTNIARHAEATKVRIGLRAVGTNIELKIQDNGKGISAAQISQPESLGLLGMRERAESLSGEIKIRGTLNKGTLIRAKIPIIGER